MHPRNIYKTLPDFKQLAITYPEFRQHIKIDLTGKARLDFSNPKALAALTKTLLLKDFNLNVEVPHDKLVPTLPLRLNYILWIEDLLKAANIVGPIEGIDIGTGACCIYSLLAAKKEWHMLATELNADSLELARRNIEANALTEVITLKHVTDKNLVLQGVLPDEKNYSFCMCNPPFFSIKEKPKNRSAFRKPSKSSWSGTSQEIETEGGEVAFIRQLIADSLQLTNKVAIYSTLVGKHCDLQVLRKELLNMGVSNTATTTFEQGKTMRWGLAWSFSISFPSAVVKPKKKDKAKPPVSYDLPDGTVLEDAISRIKELLTSLKVTFDVERSDPFTCNVSAFENTWSNQRRKRRANLKQPPEKRQKIEEPQETNEGMEVSISVETDKTVTEDLNGDPILNAEEPSNLPKTGPILEFVLKVLQADETVSLEAIWLKGSSGKEGLHQILQYFKNNWTSKNTKY